MDQLVLQMRLINGSTPYTTKLRTVARELLRDWPACIQDSARPYVSVYLEKSDHEARASRCIRSETIVHFYGLLCKSQDPKKRMDDQLELEDDIFTALAANVQLNDGTEVSAISMTPVATEFTACDRFSDNEMRMSFILGNKREYGNTV